MARRTLQASTQGIKDIRKALRRKQGGQTYLAGAVDCSRQTIWSLLKGNPIDCDVFMDVCTKLGLKWEDIAEPEAAEPVQNKDSNLDALVQQVRSRLLPFITAPDSIIGTMRMFSVSQPVPVDKIYIDLNVLEQVSSSRHFSNWRGEYEPGNRQDFDRLSLSQVKQKGVEAISVIKDYAKLLVLGKPGAGKTTFLKSLAVKCIQPEEEFFADLVPLFVALPEFAKMVHKMKTSWNLLDYLAKELANQSNGCDANAKEILVQGRSLVLLDGLDEVPPEDIENVIDAVRDFGYRNNRLVITCRTQSQKELEGFTDVEVADFTPKQVDRFVENWFNIVDSGTQASLTTQLQHQLRATENKTIAELTVTPVLLNLICAVFRDEQGNLPKKRSQLYEKGMRHLLERLKRMPSDRKLTIDIKEEFLAELAVMLFEKNDYFPEEQTLEKFICNYFGVERSTARNIMKIFETETGLLIERSAGYWSFSHLTFQEYLVAKWFHGHTGLTGLVNATTDHYWREVFILMAEMSSNLEQFLVALKSEIDLLSNSKPLLTSFLGYIEGKSLIVQTELKIPYSLAIIRTFYFEKCLLFVLRQTGLSIHAGFKSGEPILDVMALDSTLIQTFISGHIWIGGRERFQGEMKNRISNFVKVFDVNACQNAYEDNLKYFLENLRDRLPSSDDDLDGCFSWWQENGCMWLSDIHKVIKYRNLFLIFGEQWSEQYQNLSEEHQNYFRKYHTLNWFLIDCLNSDTSVSNNVRQEIEETLLLPSQHRN
ncbi:MAG: NACHT domain-containing protein [Microcoleus sp. PH2017_15_JOR_U_A]|uniref:NACHT domain-containing protein n=1 Tax=unclassified Microcoleus TaxID=2642155 RepID=UPI001D6A0826|nr:MULTISPECIES: NACHT domain-containing protein [unclassified Microcoleus]MCC3453825.1 NACHT domain-containing protein [Microcoleus sp. PH2017_08_TRC_O_A]MCC3471815.1 NACHT domain-containing protein [Microcoleus sp. PH2017_13_LAR_U_A]MCC3484318.1 NACHT domain-containing protein [Microcoleus sp. PH2017_14_LAR_D_A]MCC3496370.1 NACHT domain-containing protein [Microcoleus sp. PH2017_15_JOR_U_A]MCC3597088.1 NACHT domain-containing protein [Microcoleus sp. PH2017_26_ELK_O_A]